MDDFIESVEGENIEEKHIYDIICPNCGNRVKVYREYIGNLFAQDVYKCYDCEAMGYIFRGVIHHKDENSVRNIKLDEQRIDEEGTTYTITIDNSGRKEIDVYDTFYGNESINKIPDELYYKYENIDDDIVCKICGDEFEHFDKFLIHILSEHDIIDIIYQCYTPKSHHSSDRKKILTKKEFQALEDAEALNEYHEHCLTHIKNKLEKYVEEGE